MLSPSVRRSCARLRCTWASSLRSPRKGTTTSTGGLGTPPNLECPPVGEVWAIVVTRDRRDLLSGCLAALEAQERAPDRVLVVDNASSDGTPDMVRAEHPSVELLSLRVNEGGAGGFHEGMKHAHAGGAEWLWLMDDDTVPEPGALSELLAAAGRLDDVARPSWPAAPSGATGRVHPMNALWPDRTRWPALAVEGAERRVMPGPLGHVPSRCSCTAARSTRHGLPRKELLRVERRHRVHQPHRAGRRRRLPGARAAACSTTPPTPTPRPPPSPSASTSTCATRCSSRWHRAALRATASCACGCWSRRWGPTCQLGPTRRRPGRNGPRPPRRDTTHPSRKVVRRLRTFSEGDVCFGRAARSRR